MSDRDNPIQERLNTFLSYLASDPDNAALLADIATMHYQLGRWAEAQSTALQSLQLDVTKSAAHAVVGLTKSRAGEFAQAIHHLKQAIALGEQDPMLHYQLADVLIRSGRHEEAEAHAWTAAQHASDLPFAPALYIRALHYVGKLSEAAAYGEAFCNQTEHAAANLYGALATVYMDSNDLDNSRRTALLALNKDPEDIDGNTTMGMLALAETDAKQAQHAFVRVLKQQQTNGRAWLGMGLTQLLNGELSTAAESLQKATENLKGHLGTLNALAWTHILNKDAASAEATLLRALETDRTFAETHGTLAVVELMKGNLDSATQAVKRANALDRKNFAGNFAQSLIQQVSGNSTQAKIIVEQLLSTPVLPNGQTLQGAIAQALAKSR